MKNVAWRMVKVIPIIDLLIVSVFMLLFSPIVIMSLTADPPDPAGTSMLKLPLLLLIPLVLLSVSVAIFTVNYSMKEELKWNTVDVTKDKIMVTIATNQIVLASTYEIPILHIYDIYRPDSNYWTYRKKETCFFHRIMSYHYKRRYGDLFHKYSDIEDILLIKLNHPVKASHLNNIWSNRNVLQEGKFVYEVLVNIDKEQHLAFRKFVLGR